MKKLILILFISSTCPFLNAQNNMDSLWAIWSDMERADSTRFKAMYKICDSRARSEPDSVYNWANELLIQTKEKGSLKYQAGALLQLGRAYSYKGDYLNTSIAYDQSLAIYEDVGYKFGVGRVLAYMAGNLANQGNYPAAIRKAEQCMAIALEIEDKKLSSGVAKVLGHSYKFLGNTVKAFKVFEKGIWESEIIGDKEALAWHLHALADIYSEFGEQEKSEEYHRWSLSIYEEIDDKLGIAGIIEHQAAESLSKRNFQTAIEEYNRAERIYEEMGAKNAHVNNLLGLANVYMENGDYEKAKIQLSEAESIVNEMGYTVLNAELLVLKGQIDQLQGDHSNAIHWCNRAFQTAGELKRLKLQWDACNCLYNAYKATGQNNKALVYLEKLNELSDSLKLDETAKEIQKMEFQKQILADSLAKAEEARIVQEAHQEEVRKKNMTKNIAIGSGLMVLLLAGGIYNRLRFTRKAKAIIEKEKDRSENLLLNILPAEVAAELKEKGKADARDFDMVSMLFTDFKGFTEASTKLSAQDLVSEINTCFEAFDGIMSKFGVEKIKTIGDAYMAAGGLPVPADDSVKNTVLAALEMQDFIVARHKEQVSKGLPAFQMRVGIHTGPVVAGIVGVKKFQYDIWGDTVNTASRMESNGKVGKVNISEATYELLKDDPQFEFDNRGKIEAKGKGEMVMYFVGKA